MDYLIAIDQGTTSSRAMAFDCNGRPVSSHQIEIKQYFPQPAWVEHDGDEILSTTITCLRELVKKAADMGYHNPLSIGITNQRETSLLWDKKTGKPIGKAIVWQDRRTSASCGQLKDKGFEATIIAKTGLLLDPYFSASKLNWMLNQDKSLFRRAKAGELAFGTIECFLLWHLTGGRHQSDVTNASRTMLMNIHTLAWDDDLLEIFDVPRALLPEISPNVADFGFLKDAILGRKIPIGAMIGDQQSAAVGQGCIRAGMSKSTYGTGCFVLHNTGGEALSSQHKLLTTVAYQIQGECTYALEGSIFIAGAAIQWLRDGLNIIENAKDTEAMVCELTHNNGVYMVPAFAGLGAPHWAPDARGAIFGITRDTDVCDFVRAALESVAYQTHDLVQAIRQDTGHEDMTMRVDGGMVANNWLMQFLADILKMDVERPKVSETTAMGAAFLAGLSQGVYGDLSAINSFWHLDRHFVPHMKESERTQLLAGWNDAVRRTLS